MAEMTRTPRTAVGYANCPACIDAGNARPKIAVIHFMDDGTIRRSDVRARSGRQVLTVDMETGGVEYDRDDLPRTVVWDPADGVEFRCPTDRTVYQLPGNEATYWVGRLFEKLTTTEHRGHIVPRRFQVFL